MRKRKVLTAIDTNILSRFQRLESDDELTTTTEERVVATSSKTPRISNSSFGNQGIPPKPRQLCTDQIKNNNTTPCRMGVAKLHQRSDEVVQENALNTSTVTVEESTNMSGKKSSAMREKIAYTSMVFPDCDQLNQAKLREKPMAEAERAQRIRLNKPDSSEDMDVPVLKHSVARNDSPIWHSAPQYDTGKFEDHRQNSSIKKCPRGLVSGGYQGYAVGGDRLRQPESLDGSEVTLPTLGDMRANKYWRSWQKMGKQQNMSNLAPQEATDCFPMANIQFDMSPAKTDESDSSVEVWSIEDESASCPILFEVDRKKYQHPPLPPGWQVKVSKSRKLPFYVHPDFGATWHCPVVLQTKEELVAGTTREPTMMKRREEGHTMIGQHSSFEASANLFSNSIGDPVFDVASYNESEPQCMSDLVNRYHRDIILQRHSSNALGIATRNGSRYAAMTTRLVHCAKKARGCSASTQGSGKESHVVASWPQIPFQSRCESLVSYTQRKSDNRSLPLENKSCSCPQSCNFQTRTAPEAEDCLRREFPIDNLTLMHSKILYKAASPQQSSNGNDFSTAPKGESPNSLSDTKAQSPARMVLSAMRTNTATSTDSPAAGRILNKRAAPMKIRPSSKVRREDPGENSVALHKNSSVSNSVARKPASTSPRVGFGNSAQQKESILVGSHLSRSKDGQTVVVSATSSAGGQYRTPSKIRNVDAATNKPICAKETHHITATTAVFSETKVLQSAKANWKSPTLSDISDIEGESIDGSSCASPLRDDCFHDPKHASERTTETSGDNKDVLSQPMYSNLLTVASLEESTSENDWMLTGHDQDPFASPTGKFEGFNTKKESKAHAKEGLFQGGAIGAVEVNASKELCKSKRHAGAMGVKGSILTACGDCSALKDEDNTSCNETLSMPSYQSEMYFVVRDDGAASYAKQQARNEADQSRLKTSSKSDLTFSASTKIDDDESTGGESWGDDILDYDTGSEAGTLGSQKKDCEMIVHDAHSTESNVNSDVDDEVLTDGQTKKHPLSSISPLRKPSFKQMGRRVLNPPLPLCSLQQLDVLFFRGRSRMARHKSTKKDCHP